jgi:hypothetical protein
MKTIMNKEYRYENIKITVDMRTIWGSPSIEWGMPTYRYGKIQAEEWRVEKLRNRDPRTSGG